MISVPGFLLRRLYVKGSLRNTQDGLQFQLKNQLGAGYAKKLLPLKVDDKEAPLADCLFTVDGNVTPFSAVSPDSPFTLVVNKTTLISVKGMTLSPGPHKIAMTFEVTGLGVLTFDFNDVVD